MDDEQKYKDALERAKKLYEQGTITESLSYVFPELQEYEDEKIRKALINFFKTGAEYGEQTNGVYDKDILSWLLKQGQVKESELSQPIKGTSKENGNSLTNKTWSEEDEIKF